MDLSANLEIIRQNIQNACTKAHRDPDEVRIMAVSKKQSADVIRQAVDCGLTLFGENRIQEARLKMPECPNRIEWHFIGHLQTNKAKEAAAFFHTIQGVDSMKLAEELEKAGEKLSRQVRVLLEVNVAGEATKFGFQPGELLENIEALSSFNRLEVHGFMAMAPIAVDAERIRPVFARLKQLQLKCQDIVGIPFPVLSMGMSGDYQVAIEEGSTLVRLGTCLFGQRQ